MMQSLFSPRRSLAAVSATNNGNNSLSRLQEIVTLLQEKRESLAACRSRLSLTCKEIQEICSSLYSSSLSSHSESSSFLVTLLANVRAIRILPEPASSSPLLTETLNLSPFHRLTHLEVRNVAISRVIHLSQLRSQLNHLVLYACVETLSEVLQECGGDKCTDSFLWSELHSLHVTSCQALDLGNGLQLAPWLKTLDLTFNELTDNSIQSLSTLLTLHSLMLNFNSLQRIPVLAPSARTSLKILHLRQNQLESLSGLEQLHSLEELDVAYNCISNGEALSSLSFLTHLVKLNLEFNPVSYVKDYRLVVLRRVSSSVNRKKFQLDDKPLSQIDKDTVGTMAALYSCVQPELSETWSSSRLHPQPTVIVTSVRAEETVDDTAPPLALAADSEQKSNSVSGSARLGSVKNDSFSVTPITPTSLSASKRRKASRMREVEIADPSQTSTHLTSEENEFSTTATVAAAATPEPISDAGHLTTKQKVEELRRVFGQENWLTSQAGNEVRLLLGWQEAETKPMAFIQKDINSQAGNNLVDEINSTISQSGKDDAILVLESDKEPSVHGSFSPLNQSKDEDGESDDDLHVYVVQRQITTDIKEERLLTVSAVYLCEKDALTGQTLFCWKKSSLQAVMLVQTPDFPSHPIVEVQLLFHPTSRRGNDPIYVMEQDDYEELDKLVANGISNLEPATVTNNDSIGRRSNDEMSCMKCDGKFPSVRAAVRLRTAVSSPLLKGQLEEYSVCPYCASDMVFAIDQTHTTTVTNSNRIRTDGSGSGSESVSSSSNQSGSDVVVATNDPYSPGSEGSDTSEEGSVEVMDKTSRRLTSSIEDATPHGSSYKEVSVKSTTKSLSSRSHSSKSSSQASHSNSSARLLSLRSSSSSVPPFTYSYADFSQVDHRLRLYCEMFLLSHHTEEFHGLIKAELVTMNAGPTDEEIIPSPAILVVTSHKVYFLRITSTCTEQPEKWLNLESSYPLSQLVHILTVIGNQGLVLKFGTTSPHLILLRDQRRTKNVTHFLTDIYEKSGLGIPALRTDLMADQWMALDGLVRGDQDTVSTTSADIETGPSRSMSDSNSRVFLFCITCRVDWGNGQHQQQQMANYDNTALMVTSDRMALVRGDPRWLTSHQVQFRTWGVSLLSLQQLVNLVSLESFVSKPEKIRCYFLDEASGMEEKWTVTLATREAVDQLIEAVRYPWEAIFSVELEINELDE